MKKTLITVALLTMASLAKALTIDVMIVYDNQAIKYLEKHRISPKLYAVDLVNKINVPFRNSGIEVKYRLAHSMALPYNNVAGRDGMKMVDDLTYITNHRQVKEIRRQKQADLVHFVVDIDHPRYGSWMAGIAYEPCFFNGKINVSCSRKYAYSVSSIQDTHYSSIAGSSAHEIGHNLGAGHARNPNKDEHNIFQPYGYGHYFTTRQGYDYHTVMAYTRGGSRRAPYFSTPCKTYKGEVVGKANYADNRQAILRTMGMVANYYGPKQAYEIPTVFTCPDEVTLTHNETTNTDKETPPATVIARGANYASADKPDTTASTTTPATVTNTTADNTTTSQASGTNTTTTRTVETTSATTTSQPKRGIIFSSNFGG